ncbi:lysine decarboxylase [Plasmodium gonderi]|uniref:Lysine decarboxylase n=1 Tax=Plasmodium gonderi TaxID=77519 RepID=A0A1Y1JDD9_PLAGO|nr:lysine decarboxylase [Plasmodium gonderi]GAW79237.1 lysine decarboxylase [Plasmodium gonderi]
MNSANDAIFYGDNNSVHHNNICENAPEKVIKNGNTSNDYIMSNDGINEGVYFSVERGENGTANATHVHAPFHQHMTHNQQVIATRGERRIKEYSKSERDKYEKIEEIERYLNINNATNVCSLRIKLWEALMLYVNNINAELIYFIINCLMEVEVYWGEEATNNLQDILNLINDKKYKEVSNKIGETLSSLSVTTGKGTEENPFFYTLIVSSRRDENSNNYNSDLACELNKILQYEQNRLSNQNNNKKLEYKIIEVSNAKEALLACLINSQILSVVLVDNLTTDEEYKREKIEFYNFNEENSISNKCGNPSHMLNCSMVNNNSQMKGPLTHNMHNSSPFSSKDAMRNMILSNYLINNGNNSSIANNNHNNSSSTNMNEHKKGNNFFLKDYKFDIGNFVLGYEQLVAAPLEKMKKGFNSLVILIKSIAYIRSSVDIFCVCTSITLDKLQSVNNKIIRIFTTHDDHSDLHESILDGVKKKIKTPFFNALKAYAERPIGVFHALAISKGNSVRRSRWIQSLLDFYGVNLFKAESSATCGGLDSLLDPHGSLKEAQIMAARAYGSKYCFFVTNGTSSSNKIVMQALVKPGDVILVDRACHKSHHYGFVLCQALPCYLDPYPVSRYGIYGAVPIYVIKKTLLEYRNSNKLHLVKLIILTNCTFDGIVYNVKRVIEECLAIKPDLIFLFDEAWFAYACFHPILKFRTAMAVADKMRNKEQKKIYYKVHKKLLKKFGNVKSLDVVPAEKLLKTRLYPNPSEYKVRVYATQSIHKSLTSLRQGSVILISDDNFESHAYTPFKEAYYTHMSTSPNYQILATLDAGRAQMELEGYSLVEKQVEAAFLIRKELSEDPMISRYFRILNAEDLIPDRLRQCHNLYMKRKKKFLKEHYSSDSKYSGNMTYSCTSKNQGKTSITEYPPPHEKRSVIKYEDPIQSSNISSHECANDVNGCTNHFSHNSFVLGDSPNNTILSSNGNNNSMAETCAVNYRGHNYGPYYAHHGKLEKGIDAAEKSSYSKVYSECCFQRKGIKLYKRKDGRNSRMGRDERSGISTRTGKEENSETQEGSNNESILNSDENENVNFFLHKNKKNYSSSSFSTGVKNFLEYFECSWLSEDEFVLDPTRITLFTGYSGIDGDTFKVKWLMDKYGIQINKTSINSVLFQTNIGTTGSSCLFLKSCLSLISQELDQKKSLFNERDLNQFNDNVYNLVSNYIDLSEFSEFHPLFKKRYVDSRIFNKEGDLRMAFYLAYEEDYVEYILMNDLKDRIRNHEIIVSASFIIPYPPGFPVLVPGQLVSQEIVDYLSGLSVKEIHGYDENVGFRCFYNFILEYFYNLVTSDPYGYYHKIDKKIYDKMKHLNLSKRRNTYNSAYHLYIYDNETNKMKKVYVCIGNLSTENNTAVSDTYEDVTQFNNLRTDKPKGTNHFIGAYENMKNNSQSVIPTIPTITNIYTMNESGGKGTNGSAKYINERIVIRDTDCMSNSGCVSNCTKRESREGELQDLSGENVGINDSVSLNIMDKSFSKRNFIKCGSKKTRTKELLYNEKRQLHMHYHISNDMLKQDERNSFRRNIKENILNVQGGKDHCFGEIEKNLENYQYQGDGFSQVFSKLNKDKKCKGCNHGKMEKTRQAKNRNCKNRIDYKTCKVEDTNSCTNDEYNKDYKHRADKNHTIRSGNNNILQKRKKKIGGKKTLGSDLADASTGNVGIHSVDNGADDGDSNNDADNDDDGDYADNDDGGDNADNDDGGDNADNDDGGDNADNDDDGYADSDDDGYADSDDDDIVKTTSNEGHQYNCAVKTIKGSRRPENKVKNFGKMNMVVGIVNGRYNAKNKEERRGTEEKPKYNDTDDSNSIQSGLSIKTHNNVNYISYTNSMKKTTKCKGNYDGRYTKNMYKFIPKLRQSNPVMCNKIKKSGLVMQRKRLSNINYWHRQVSYKGNRDGSVYNSDARRKNNNNKKNGKNKNNNNELDCAREGEKQWCRRNTVEKNIPITGNISLNTKREDLIENVSANENGNEEARNCVNRSNIIFLDKCLKGDIVKRGGSQSRSNGNDSVDQGGYEKVDYNANYYFGKNTKMNVEEVYKMKDFISPNESQRNDLSSETLLKNEIYTNKRGIDIVNVQMGGNSYTKDTMSSEIHFHRSSENKSSDDNISNSGRRRGLGIIVPTHLSGNHDLNNENLNSQVKNEIAFCGNEFHYDENELKMNSGARENNEIDKNAIRKLNSLNNNSYINNLITNVDDDTFIHKEGNFFLECALTNSEMNGSSFEMEMSLNNVYYNGGEGSKHPPSYDRE